MSELCTITPVSAFMSTNLSSKIDCFQQLGARILRLLGHPMINVELHPDQLYDAISMACEFFTQYAGYTKEYIIFDSRLYVHNAGLRLDHLFTVAHTGFAVSSQGCQNTCSPCGGNSCSPCGNQECQICRPNPNFNVHLRGNLYVATSALPYSYFLSSSALSASMPSCGIEPMQILDECSFNQLSTFDPNIGAYFKLSPQKELPHCADPSLSNVESTSFNNMFDYDVMDYRKVMDVCDFEEGSSNGFSSLFSMEQTLAQQTFYSYAMGNFGFDLLSWHCVKDWQDTREKLLALRRDIHFDNRTQYLRFYPQPKPEHQFVGILECYVERPLRDIVKEKWVLEYATALAKVMWGRILTRIGSVQLLGGGIINGDLVLQEGNTDKLRLEEMLMTGSGGFAAYEPIMMFVR